MDQMINYSDVKNSVNKVTGKSMFENMLNEVEKVNPNLGGIEELGAFLSLEEKEFKILAPIFLDEMEKSFNNISDKTALIQAMNLSGLRLEDLQESYTKLINNIDTQFKDILPDYKRDFLKHMLGITYNCIQDAQGASKRIINVPIELCSENAKIPTYAHVGDGAVDLYSPDDYVINPGEKVIIPVDIKIAIPYGYAMLIHPRSGISAKTKLRVANSIGLIDCQYKDNIGVIVENIEPKIKDITYEFDEKTNRPIITSIEHGSPYYIEKGQRFAQMRLVEVPTINFVKVKNIKEYGEDRGGGFGSSGNK